MAGLLDEIKDGISEGLGNLWDGVSDFAGGLLEVSPERQAEVDKYYADLETARRNDPYGRHDWRFKEPSTDSNKVKRFIKRIPTGVAGVMDEAQTVFSTPQHMAKGAIDLGTGGLLNLVGAETIGEEQRAVADAFGGVVKATFEDWDSFSNAVANNPVEVLSIMAGGGMTTAKLASLANNTALKPAIRNTLYTLLGDDPVDSIMTGVFKSNLNPNLSNLGQSKLPITVFQGNEKGAIFTKMDMNKIGSNSGTKRQGHGLYVSENKDTGKNFARYDFDMMREAKLLSEIETNTPLETRIWDDLATGVYPDTIRNELMKDVTIKKDSAQMAEANKILREVEERFDTAMSQLYEIDLSDEAVSRMIRRELPLTGQPDNVQALMRQNGMKDTDTGADFYEALTEEFADKVGGFGAEKAASAYLYENGIPGSKFVDVDGNNRAMSEGKADPKANNYVLYSTDTSKILKRQDIPITENTGDRIGITSTIGQEIDARFATRKSDKDRLQKGVMDVQTELQGTNNIIVGEQSIVNSEGYPFVGTMSDGSAGSGIITSVNGSSVVVDGKGVRRTGGQDHMLIPENVDRGILWASAKDAVGKIAKSANQARQLYKKDPLLLPFSMSPTGSDFSNPITQTMLNSAINGLDAKQIAILDDLIRTTSKESVKNSKGEFYIRSINKKWRGTNSKNPLEGTTGSERKEIARIIDVNFRTSRGTRGSVDYDIGGKLVKGQNNGVVSYPTARLANADEKQLNKKEGTLQNVGLLNMQELIGKEKPITEAYDTVIKGQPVSMLPEKERNISILDLFDNTKADGSPMTADNMTDSDFRKLTMQNPPIGLITHDILMNLSKKGLLD